LSRHGEPGDVDRVLVFMVSLIEWTLPPQRLDLDPKLVPPEPREGLRVRLRPQG